MSHIFITESGTFSTDCKKLASSQKFKNIVKKYSKVKTMKMDTHIFNYCLRCKYFNPNKTTEINVYCDKQKSWVENYHALKCQREKYFKNLEQSSCQPL